MKEENRSTSQAREKWLFPVTLTVIFLAFVPFIFVNEIRQYFMSHRECVPSFANGRTIQISVESLKEKAGRYPATANEIEAFLPRQPDGTPGKWPENMYSVDPFAPTVIEDNELRTTADLEEAIRHPARLKKRAPGLIVYCQLDKGQSYAIYAMDGDGIVVPVFFSKDFAVTDRRPR